MSRKRKNENDGLSMAKRSTLACMIGGEERAYLSRK